MARLHTMGGRANEASFGAGELCALRDLIAHGIVLRAGRFEVEIVPEADRVHKMNTIDEPTEPHAMDLVVQSAPKDHTVAPTSPQNTPGPSQPQPVKTTFHLRKLSFRKLERLRPDRIRGLAARIVERMESLGPELKVRTLERLLHAERFPEWADALGLLTARKSIIISGRLIKLLDPMASEKLPNPYPEDKPKKKRRRRPRTAWFKEKLRRSEELGVPLGELIELDRLGSQSHQLPPTWG